MSTLGLVLAGGAARGAYAAGIMRFLFRSFPRHLGQVPWPDLVSGTSVGALNGMFAAARDLDAVDEMAKTWQEMRVGDVYHMDSGGIMRIMRATWKAASGAALVDATPLIRLMREKAPIRSLRQSIDGGQCTAFIVSTTRIADGRNVLFVDSRDELNLRPLPGAIVRRGPTQLDHLLASAALPMMFPPVRIQGELYADGGLRQNTPLRPAIMGGADRVIVIGPTSDPGPGQVRHQELTPNLPFLAGKTLNALLADPVERDIVNARTINEIIAWGVDHYGPEFATRLEADLGYREVVPLFLRPSVDLGMLAAQAWKTRPPVPTQVRWLLDAMSDEANAHSGEADLLSYLLFDKSFTAEAERIGFEDAQRQEERIAAFMLSGTN